MKLKPDALKKLLFKRELELGRRIYYDEIADATGLSWSTVERYINGRVSQPRLSTVARLAKYFEVPIEELLEDDEGNRKATPATAEVAYSG